MTMVHVLTMVIKMVVPVCCDVANMKNTKVPAGYDILMIEIYHCHNVEIDLISTHITLKQLKPPEILIDDGHANKSDNCDFFTLTKQFTFILIEILIDWISIVFVISC